MANDATPRECRMTETLLKNRRVCTPNELTMPWETSNAAYIPRVLPAVGLYDVPIVAVIEIRLAPPNVMPVVTATWPKRLNLECVSLLNINPIPKRLPASDPRCKSLHSRRSKNSGPKIWSTARRDGRNNLSHSEPNK